MLSNSEQPTADARADGDPHLNTARPTRDEVLELAWSLPAIDQTRLIAAVWESLPQKNRTALALWLEHARHSPDERPLEREPVPRAPRGPTVWDLLFDPARTSGLYSAPRRFDLATIFVVTAAYSILFGAMAGLDVYFGPVTKAAVGIFVTVIGVCQAFNQHVANPRGVSVVAGAVTLTVILILGRILGFNSDPMFISIIIGPICGAFCGYLAGTVVAGVFLVADLLRDWFTSSAGSSDSRAASETEKESPWD
jgi:hypothetical protein